MMRLIAIICYSVVLCLRGGINRLFSWMCKHGMVACGRNVRFSAITSDFTYRNLSIGNDVYIGPRAMFVATKSRIFIADKVLFGPNVTIIGGDHRMTDIGRFMYDIQEKRPGDDQDVRIGTDVWVAANVTILKGVTIGRGVVIAAASLVIRDVPPYAIVGGVPAHVLKYRFSIEDTLAHERQLYEPDQRLTKEQLILSRGL